MGTLWQDLRYGFRMLLKHRGFTIIAILALALGIGANTAIFSVVNAVLLKPLPFDDPERLVMVFERRPQQNRDANPVAPADFIDWKNQNQVFERMAAYSAQGLNLTGTGEPEQVTAYVVTPGFFQTLGAHASLGRTLLEEMDAAGGERAAVLSHKLWQSRFGANSEVVGKTITLDTESYRVVGVMPPEFRYPDDEAALWVTPSRSSVPGAWFPGTPDPATIRTLHYLSVIARLKPGVELKRAHAEMETVAGRLEQQYPNENRGHTARVVSLHEEMVGDVRPALWVLLGAVGFVLLIACANVANLLLARATARHREMAVRTALGAGRLRLIRQLLTESALLSLAGGAIGLLIAVWGVDLLVAVLPENLRRVGEINLDASVLVFTLGVSLVTGIFFGLAPALQASRFDLNTALKEGGRSATEGFGQRRLRGLLVVSEVALTIVLLIGASLLARSFLRLTRVDPGFDPQHLLTMQLSLPRVKYDAEPKVAAFYDQVLQRFGTIPGVESVGATWTLPLSGQEAGRGFEIEGYTPAPNERTNAAFGNVSPNYFNTMRIPVVRGREFTEGDRADAQGVIIINEAFARQYFRNADPLGKRMRLRGDGNPWLTIVGVVGDVRHTELAAEPRSQMYLSYLQSPPPSMNVVVRTRIDALSLAPVLRREVWAVDPDQPVANISMMSNLVSNSVAGRRFNMLLVGLFAAMATILAAVGIFGVMNYTVTQRTHEIGIRMALGAQSRDVLRMIVRQGMILVLSGVALGLVIAFAVTRIMSSLLFGVSAKDPLTFVGVSAALAAIALAACYIPARRATKVDPMEALRYE